MAINLNNVRYIETGEPLDESVLNRPIKDFADEVTEGLTDILTGGAYAWEPGSYTAGIAVIHGGQIYISKQTTTQTPSATATHWKRVITTDDGISGATITNAVPTTVGATRPGHVWYVY